MCQQVYRCWLCGFLGQVKRFLTSLHMMSKATQYPVCRVALPATLHMNMCKNSLLRWFWGLVVCATKWEEENLVLCKQTMYSVCLKHRPITPWNFYSQATTLNKVLFDRKSEQFIKTFDEQWLQNSRHWKEYWSLDLATGGFSFYLSWEAIDPTFS